MFYVLCFVWCSLLFDGGGSGMQILNLKMQSQILVYFRFGNFEFPSIFGNFRKTKRKDDEKDEWTKTQPG